MPSLSKIKYKEILKPTGLLQWMWPARKSQAGMQARPHTTTGGPGRASVLSPYCLMAVTVQLEFNMTQMIPSIL